MDALRDDADRFIAELDEESYLHFAGQKETFELVPIYERHAELTTLDTALALGASVSGGRNDRELWRFACEGYLGQLRPRRGGADRRARGEAQRNGRRRGRSRTATCGRAIMNEPDRGRRERLERARNELDRGAHQADYVRASQAVHRETERLGAELHASSTASSSIRSTTSPSSAAPSSVDTESLWEDAGDRFFRSRVGLGLGEVERWDVGRVWRAVKWDSAFPAERMLPALEATLADSGVDLHAQQNVELDLEDRPNKDPRAFCVPDRDPRARHPRDQAERRPRRLAARSSTRPGTPSTSRTPRRRSRWRRSGSATTPSPRAGRCCSSTSTIDPAWLDAPARLPAAARVRSRGRDAAALVRPPLLREAPLRDRVPRRGRRRRRCSRATSSCSATRSKVEPSDTDYLADVDDGFYASQYLRAWAFEAQLRAYLREKFGNAWFSQRDAGSLIRELWSEGQKPTADEILEEVTGERLELAAVADRVREALAAA